MEKIPARAGWLWIKHGFALFRKQPGGLSSLFLGYLFLMFAVSLLPLLGQIAQIILMPLFSVTFMQAFLYVEQNKRIRPNLLAIGFHKPAVMPLLALGLLYLLAAAIAIGASTLADDGLLWKLASGQLDPKSPLAQDTRLSNGFLLAAALYFPAAMAFFFAAPLIYWKRMSLGKALFFSVFAVLKAMKAFIVFVVAWLVICILAGQFLMLIFSLSELAVMLMLPLWVTMVVVLQGSFFSAYQQIFGAPLDTDVPLAPPADIPPAPPQF